MTQHTVIFQPQGIAVQVCSGSTVLQAQILAGIQPEKITAAAIAGNTAMHHLLLGINPKPLVTPPYMPAVSEAIERNGARILPNIAGFVGGDTVGCMLATRFDQLEELSLLLDIGTNGEMVLGDRNRRIACSTAAGPAFEGAKISCGMRGAEGAIDHVYIRNGEILYHTIGDHAPKGLCGSGLLDLVAVLLDMQVIDDSGRMKQKQFKLCGNVVLTQKDVREVQLAKAAIRTGVELLVEEMACRQRIFGMCIWPVLLETIWIRHLPAASACCLRCFWTGSFPSAMRQERAQSAAP